MNIQASPPPQPSLELAIEGAGLGTWDWNIATGETIFNARWAEIVGYELHDLQAQMATWQKLVHPEDYSAVMAAVQGHLSGATPFYRAEYRLRHKDGRWIWVQAHGRIYERGADGTPLRAAGTHQDISDRKETEAALLLSRQMYKHTVELTTQIPWTASPDGAIVSCDPVWETYTGLSVEAALSHDWLEAVHPDDRERMYLVWTHSIATGEPYRVSNRLRRRDGEYRHCESRAQPQRNDAGEIVRGYGATEDIHERTLAEQSLRASETRRILALEGAQLATWDWHIRTGEVIRDAAWFAMLGFEENAATRETAFWSNRVHPEDWLVNNKLWEEHCKDETQAFRAEYRIRHKSGEWRWMISHGRVVERDADGPTRACGINQDVTERRHAQDSLANSERFSRLLLDSYEDCVALLDQRGCLLYMNPAGRRRLGLSQNDGGASPSWIDLWNEEERDGIRQRIAAAFDGGAESFQTYRAPDGAVPGWWDVLLSPLPQGPDEPAKLLAVAREITRLKEQEEIQRESVEKARLQAILENLNEGIIIAAPDGLVLLMNRAAQQMYEFDTAGNNTVRCEDLFSVVDAGDSTHTLSSYERPLARAVRGEAFTGLEAHLRNRRNGRQWIASCGSTPVRSPGGELLLAVLSVRDVTAEREAAAEIRHANAALHELSGQLLRMQDEERRRIARELHDGTVQLLSAALMNLTVLTESPGIRELEFESRLLAKSLNLAHQSVRELRTMSYLLHPPVLDELGLGPALRSWIDGFSERTGIPVDISLPDDISRMPPEMETALFRMVQEALGNVQRHAQCTTASVTLAVIPSAIRLEVVDDGKGFDPASPKDTKSRPGFGVGLLGMHERASQAGGSLTIDSRPGKTVICVILPLGNNHG